MVFQEVFGLDEKEHFLATWLTASIIFTEISSIIKHCLRLRFPVPDGLIAINNGAKGILKDKIKAFFGNSSKNNEKLQNECDQVEKGVDDDK